MRLIILFTLFLTACSTAYGQSNTQVNGDLTDECLVSFVQLEEAFIKDETSRGFNPFGSIEDIAQEFCFSWQTPQRIELNGHLNYKRYY